MLEQIKSGKMLKATETEFKNSLPTQERQYSNFYMILKFRLKLFNFFSQKSPWRKQAVQPKLFQNQTSEMILYKTLFNIIRPRQESENKFQICHLVVQFQILYQHYLFEHVPHSSHSLYRFVTASPGTFRSKNLPICQKLKIFCYSYFREKVL